MFWTWTRTRTFWTRKYQDSSPEKNDLNGRSRQKDIDCGWKYYSIGSWLEAGNDIIVEGKQNQSFYKICFNFKPSFIPTLFQVLKVLRRKLWESSNLRNRSINSFPFFQTEYRIQNMYLSEHWEIPN